jgi:hypothetical protein
MSKRGWIRLEYDQRVWIPCPPVFPEGDDLQAWALLFAAEWWARSGRKHGQREVHALARTLAEIHQYGYAHLAMHNGLIHLPSLDVVPLLVGFGVWGAVGDANAQLRALGHADDPEAMQPPVVEEIPAASAGPGIKVLAYTRRGEDIMGFVSYVWRSDEHETAVRMFTACPDLGRLQRAIQDMDQLATGVTIIPRD